MKVAVKVWARQFHSESLFLIPILYCSTLPVVYIPDFGKYYYWKNEKFEVKCLDYITYSYESTESHSLNLSFFMCKMWLVFFFPLNFLVLLEIFLWKLISLENFTDGLFCNFYLEITPFKVVCIVFSWLWTLDKSLIDIAIISHSINIGGKKSNILNACL